MDEFMVSATIHRRRAREFLARAVKAQNRSRKLHFLRLAVDNCVCAQNLEAEGPSDVVEE
jgi:hypothetical protein